MQRQKEADFRIWSFGPDPPERRRMARPLSSCIEVAEIQIGIVGEAMLLHFHFIPRDSSTTFLTSSLESGI